MNRVRFGVHATRALCGPWCGVGLLTLSVLTIALAAHA